MTHLNNPPGRSGLEASRGLRRARSQFMLASRAGALNVEHVAALEVAIKCAAFWWVWEIQHYMHMCEERAVSMGTPLRWQTLRTPQSLIKLVYPKSENDEQKTQNTARAFAARGIISNRFVAMLLAAAAERLPRVLDGNDYERSDIGRAVVSALDILERTISYFVLVDVQWLEQLLSKNRRIAGAVSATVHSRDFYEVSRQTLFRELPSNVYYDYSPHVAVLSLRTALERKLRESLAVKGFEGLPPRSWRRRFRELRDAVRGRAAAPREQQRHRINVSDIFRLWSKLGLRVIAPGVDVGQLRRIYWWSNQVVHGAHRTSLPEIWFAVDHTLALFRGVSTKNGATNVTIVVDLSPAQQECVLREEFDLGQTWTARMS